MNKSKLKKKKKKVPFSKKFRVAVLNFKKDLNKK